MQHINISLSDLFYSFFINTILIKLQQKFPEFYTKNFKISSVQGIFPYSIWNIDLDKKYASIQSIKNIIKIYNSNNISINYLFDVKNITKEMLNDSFSNLILQQANNTENIVTLYSDTLANYIADKYPKYSIIKIAEPKDFNKKNIQINEKYNNTFNIESITYKDSAFIVLNPVCPYSCPLYDLHHKYREKENINYYTQKKHFPCILNNDFNMNEIKKNKNFISNSMLKKYINTGFKNYIIKVPSIIKETNIQYSDVDIISNYIYYLIKEEYRQTVLKIILNKLQKQKEKYSNK